MVMDRLMAITQAAPLGRQEVRDHDWLAIAFGLWRWSTDWLGPCNLAVVILVKCGLIVSDGDKSEWAIIGQWESDRAWEFASIVIPLVETLVIKLPPLNKCTSIGHHVLPLMAINVHSISGPLVPPVKFLEPAVSCPCWNWWLANAFLREDELHLWACNNISDVLCLYEPLLWPLDHSDLHLASNVLITKNCSPHLAQAMGWKCLSLQELNGPLADASSMRYSFSGTYAFILGSITAGLTAFYSFRLISLVFLTVPNGPQQSYLNTHESNNKVIIPLFLLALFAYLSPFEDIPLAIFSLHLTGVSCFHAPEPSRQALKFFSSLDPDPHQDTG